MCCIQTQKYWLWDEWTCPLGPKIMKMMTFHIFENWKSKVSSSTWSRIVLQSSWATPLLKFEVRTPRPWQAPNWMFLQIPYTAPIKHHCRPLVPPKFPRVPKRVAGAGVESVLGPHLHPTTLETDSELDCIKEINSAVNKSTQSQKKVGSAIKKSTLLQRNPRCRKEIRSVIKNSRLSYRHRPCGREEQSRL